MSDTGDNRDARQPGETPDGPPETGAPETGVPGDSAASAADAGTPEPGGAEPAGAEAGATEPGTSRARPAASGAPWSTTAEDPSDPAATPRKNPGRMTAGDWLGSLVIAVVTYGAMLVATALISVILVAVLRGESGEAQGSLSGQGLSLLTDQFGVYPFIALLFQLVAMAMGGTLSLQLVQNAMGQGSTITASLHAFPLLITLLGFAVLFCASRWHARRQVRRGAAPEGLRLWLTALATGVLLAALTVALTLGLAGRGSTAISIFSLEFRFDAMGIQLVLLPLIGGTLVSGWGRHSVAGSERGLIRETVRTLLPGLGAAVRLCGIYAGGVALVSLITLSVVAFVQGSPAAGLGTLFFGLLAVVEIMALGHLSGFTAQSTARLGYQQDTAYIWSEPVRQYAENWLMLIWIPIGIGLLWLAYAWSRRRPRTAMPTSWFAMPVTFLLLGLLMLWAGTVRYSDDGFVIQGFYGLSPAWWTPVCMLAWGFVVELLARFAAPRLTRRSSRKEAEAREADAVES